MFADHLAFGGQIDADFHAGIAGADAGGQDLGHVGRDAIFDGCFQRLLGHFAGILPFLGQNGFTAGGQDGDIARRHLGHGRRHQRADRLCLTDGDLVAGAGPHDDAARGLGAVAGKGFAFRQDQVNSRGFDPVQGLDRSGQRLPGRAGD